MISTLTYRPAKFKDWKLTFKFKKEVLKSYVEKIWGWDEKKQRNLHEENFNPEKTKIIQLENKDIGYLIVRDSDLEIYIENLILGLKYQNNGLGTKLMISIIQKSEIEKKSVRLKVLKENKRAKKFYEHLGFEEISESEYYYELKKTDCKNKNNVIIVSNQRIVLADSHSFKRDVGRS